MKKLDCECPVLVATVEVKRLLKKVGEGWSYDKTVGRHTVKICCAQCGEQYKFVPINEDSWEDDINMSKDEIIMTSTMMDREHFDALLAKPIDQLNLSTRSRMCLRNFGVKTVGELIRYREAELLRTQNFGRKSLNEIKAVLYNLGLTLNYSPK